LQVHWDVSNFESVYGMSIYEKVARWREFINDVISEISRDESRRGWLRLGY